MPQSTQAPSWRDGGCGRGGGSGARRGAPRRSRSAIASAASLSKPSSSSYSSILLGVRRPPCWRLRGFSNTGPCYNSSNGGTAFGTPWALNAQGTTGGPNIKWAQKRAVGKSASQLSWMSPRLIRAVSRAGSASLVVSRGSFLFFSFLLPPLPVQRFLAILSFSFLTERP